MDLKNNKLSKNMIKPRNQQLPKRGGWVLITKEIPVKDAFVPVFSVWYALPNGTIYIGDERHINSTIFESINEYLYYNDMNVDYLKLCIKQYLDKKPLSGREKNAAEYVLKNYDINQQINVLTPFGTSSIQAEEYTIINVNDYFYGLKDGSIQLKYMSSNINLGNTVKNQLFYLRSRGISLITGIEMLSGTIKTPNAFYLLPHPEIQRNFLRNFESYHKRYLEFKEKKLLETSDNSIFFFNEDEALKLNKQFNNNSNECSRK